MADQKKWFKVWATILLDPDHSNMSAQDVGRWTRLGALMVSQGNRGKLLLKAPAKAFVMAMECDSFEATINALKVLPNVRIEEGKNGHGEILVKMNKWYKYQVDPTHAERKQRARYKRRGEEKREEQNKSKSRNRTFVPPTLSEIQEFAQAEKLPLDCEKFYNHYESKGWKVKRVTLENWKPSARNAARDWATLNPQIELNGIPTWMRSNKTN